MSSKKTALITGASQGLGFEFAKLLAKDKYDLILVARSADKLQEVAKTLQNEHGITVTIIAKDLSLASSPQDIYDEIKKKGIIIDILINNAGFATHGKFITIPLADELSELSVNIVTLTSLTKLFVKDMVERKNGKILNIASTAAFEPGPLMAVYYATKAYVLSFSEALSKELENTGVSITTLCPGPMQTGFMQRANMGGTLLFKLRAKDPSGVAKAGYEGTVKGKRVVIPGFFNKVSVFLTPFVPRPLLLALVQKLQQ